jgi:hypothetical protein
MLSESQAQGEVDRAVPCSMPKIMAAVGRPQLTSPAERPIHLALALLITFLLLTSCETANYAPPVTAQMARSQKHDVATATLERGRTLFVHRCIECHTLPAIWKYSRDDWPKIVNDMSRRASLKPAEREAVIAYILAARKQE